jgi:hypothetical protein
MAVDEAPPRWVPPPQRPQPIGRPAEGPGAGHEHPRQMAPSTAQAAQQHVENVASGASPTPSGADALLAATLHEVLLWYRQATSKPTKSISVPPYPNQAVQAVAANPNRVGLIIRVPTAATNPVYWGDNPSVSPNDGDGTAAGVPIFPGEAMVFGPEDAGCATYLTTTVLGAAIYVRIGEQIAASG